MQYLVFRDKLCYPYNRALGNARYGAYPTHGESWREMAELLPPTMTHCAMVEAQSKREALRVARQVLS